VAPAGVPALDGELVELADPEALGVPEADGGGGGGRFWGEYMSGSSSMVMGVTLRWPRDSAALAAVTAGSSGTAACRLAPVALPLAGEAGTIAAPPSGSATACDPALHPRLARAMEWGWER
jgi:hypothetical protein